MRPMRGVLVCSLSLLSVCLLACQRITGPSGPEVLLVNAVDPDSVNAVSLFRSCVGHAFPQPSSPNAGKNYFWPNSTNFSTTDQLREYAACDGTMRQDSSDTSADQRDRGQTVHLYCDASSTRLRYFHLNFPPSLVGRHVQAGELLGYASMVGRGQLPERAWYYSSNFDIAVSDGDYRRTDNYFARLSPAAFAAWGARGLTAVSQTNDGANPTCSSYSSDVGGPGILQLSPPR